MEDRLQKLWQDSTRDLAVTFFQRALRPDLSLAEVLETLQFQDVHADLRTIRLHEVMPALTSKVPVKPAPPKVIEEKIAPRKYTERRKPAETTQLKLRLLETIAHAALKGGIRTPDLADKMRNYGFSLDTATCNLVLKGMEDAGQIIGDTGRPRTWLPKQQGRAVPEPVVIRRSSQASNETTEAPDARENLPSVNTQAMSKAEVAAQVEALRERLFK